MDLWTIIGQDHDKKPCEDDEIPSDDNNSQPTRKNFDDGKGYKCSREEKFIGDGIKISSQFCPLVSNACDQAVDAIRDPRRRKSDEGPVKELIHDEDNEYRNQQDPDKGENIRQIHGLSFTSGCIPRRLRRKMSM